MWIDKKPRLKTTNLCDFGGSPVINHSVKCWLCDKRSAIYFAYPNFIFLPCRECQKTYEGWWTKKKKWWKLFKN